MLSCLQFINLIYIVMKRLLTLVLVAIAFVACTQNDVKELTANRVDVPETLTVGFEGGDTRVELNELLKTVWSAGDEVSVFYRSYENMRWAFQGETGDRSGELKLVSGNVGDQTMDNTIVVYPYNENYKINLSEGGVEASLPAVQSYKDGSYGAEGNIMVAESSFTQFVLKSVVGWLRVELTGEGKVVQNLVVRGNGDEQIAGLCYIDAADASVTLASDESYAEEDGDISGNLNFDDSTLTEVVLDCGDGVELGAEATEFYIALLPQEFAYGVTVDIYYNDGTTASKSVDYLNLERNHIKPMTVETEDEGEHWGIAGTFNNWDSNDIPMQYLADRNMIVAYGVEFEAGTEFKLRMNEDWEYNYGSLEGGTLTVNKPVKVTAGGPNFLVSEDGVYDIYLEWNNLTLWFMEAGVDPDDVATFGLCGSFNGWGDTPDIEMTYDETERIYYATGVEFDADVEFKVRQNNLWDVNYGANYYSYIDVNSFKTAVSSGNNIRVPETGTYDIYFSEDELLIWFMESGVDRATAVEDLPDGWDGETISEIRYTSQYDDVITPNNVGAFGIEILSNEYVDGEGVITFAGELTTIGDYAFYRCYDLTSITIPDSVTTIGGFAFCYCGITSVTIPDSVTTIGDGAFENCDSLAEFKGKFAEDGGRCLIVDGVLKAFALGCGATEYTIPDSVTTIGNRVFIWCYDLTNVTIPDSVTTIGDEAFGSCYDLTSVTIGDGVTTIGYYAFYDCDNLTSVTIGDGITTIGDYTFSYCDSLTSVYCEATTPPALSDGTFYDLPDACKIYVPAESFNYYLVAEGWDDVADHLVAYDYENNTEVEVAISYITLSYVDRVVCESGAYQYSPRILGEWGKDVTVVRYTVVEGFVDNVDEYITTDPEQGFDVNGNTDGYIIPELASGRYTMIAISYTGALDNLQRGSVASVQFMIQANDDDEVALDLSLNVGSIANLTGNPDYETDYPSWDVMGIYIATPEAEYIAEGYIDFYVKNHDGEELTPEQIDEYLANKRFEIIQGGWIDSIKNVGVEGLDSICVMLKVTTIFGTNHYYHIDYDVPKAECALAAETYTISDNGYAMSVTISPYTSLDDCRVNILFYDAAGNSYSYSAICSVDSERGEIVGNLGNIGIFWYWYGETREKALYAYSRDSQGSEVVNAPIRFSFDADGYLTSINTYFEAYAEQYDESPIGTYPDTIEEVLYITPNAVITRASSASKASYSARTSTPLKVERVGKI